MLLVIEITSEKTSNFTSPSSSITLKDCQSSSSDSCSYFWFKTLNYFFSDHSSLFQIYGDDSASSSQPISFDLLFDKLDTWSSVYSIIEKLEELHFEEYILKSLFSCNGKDQWNRFQSIIKEIEQSRELECKVFIYVYLHDKNQRIAEIQHYFKFESTRLSQSFDVLGDENLKFQTLDEFYFLIHYQLPNDYPLCKDSIPFPECNFKNVKSSLSS